MMKTELNYNTPNGAASELNDGLGRWRTDLPVMSMDGEKDERDDCVVLLEVFGAESKTTAEDRGSYWYLRDWEIAEVISGKPHWLCRHGYSMDKKMVAKLAALGECPNANVTGLAPAQENDK